MLSRIPDDLRILILFILFFNLITTYFIYRSKLSTKKRNKLLLYTWTLSLFYYLFISFFQKTKYKKRDYRNSVIPDPIEKYYGGYGLLNYRDFLDEKKRLEKKFNK